MKLIQQHHGRIRSTSSSIVSSNKPAAAILHGILGSLLLLTAHAQFGNVTLPPNGATCDFCNGQGVFEAPDQVIPIDPLPEWAEPFAPFLDILDQLPPGLVTEVTCGTLDLASTIMAIPADQCAIAQEIDELKELYVIYLFIDLFVCFYELHVGIVTGAGSVKILRERTVHRCF